MSLNLESVNVHTLIKNVVGEMKKKGADAEFILNLESQQPIISGDESLLGSMLYNLLENAVKYNSSVQKKVRIHTATQGSKIVVSVSDNGIGLPAGEEKRIFDKFYRVPSKLNVPGHGLGLSFVKAIADSHRATISVKRNGDAGIVVNIKIPQAL